MTQIEELEGQWFVSQSETNKMIFLAKLIHGLTIAGRNSYRIQSEELDNPTQLRKINEIQHRVAACLCEILSGHLNESFQRSIAARLLAAADQELIKLTTQAWNEAKKNVKV